MTTAVGLEATEGLPLSVGGLKVVLLCVGHLVQKAKQRTGIESQARHVTSGVAAPAILGFVTFDIDIKFSKPVHLNANPGLTTAILFIQIFHTLQD